jgi:hypothetical protein
MQLLYSCSTMFSMSFLLQHSTKARWSDYVSDYHEILHWKRTEGRSRGNSVCGKRTHSCVLIAICSLYYDLTHVLCSTALLNTVGTFYIGQGPKMSLYQDPSSPEVCVRGGERSMLLILRLKTTSMEFKFHERPEKNETAEFRMAEITGGSDDFVRNLMCIWTPYSSHISELNIS